MNENTAGQNDKPLRLARTTRYESNWVSVFTDTVKFPAGNVVDSYHILEYSSEAAAALIENELGEVLLASIYRYATNRLEWEIPGGRMDPGETPIQTAQREALEETGWETRDARLLYVFHPTNGISNQRFHIVHAHAVRCSGQFDPEEVNRVQWFSKQQIEQMIDEQVLQDGFTLTALLLWLRQSSGDPQTD